MVEHTGIFIKKPNGLPGAMASSFLSAMNPERLCKFFRNQCKAIVKTCIGIYNGFQIKEQFNNQLIIIGF